MPRPAEAGHRYVPGLDGLRALAVLAVLVYHLNVGWAQGGLLGVGVFFTLSGYLITDLLLEHWGSSQSLGLANFWLRRARRLLPALVVMLAVVIVWVALFDRVQLPGLGSDVGAAALYMSNWWLIFQHVSYFAQFGPPQPLGHLWSLAVEEQFYLIWPWLLWVGLLWVRERKGRGRGRPHLALFTAAGALVSAAAMAWLYHPGLDPSRVYDGTDTRAFGLLVGAALAMVWPSRRTRRASQPATRRALDYAGLGALVTIGVLVWRTSQYSAFLYRGGMLLLSVATAVVVMAAVYPGSWLGRILGMRPLRWLGVRSYGIYLWHYPIIVLAAHAALQRFDLPRASLQVLLTVVVAAASWRFVEEPILRGARLPSFRAATARWRTTIGARWTWVASCAALAFLTVVSVLLGVVASPAANPLLEAGGASASGATQLHEVVTVPTPPPTTRPAPRLPATGYTRPFGLPPMGRLPAPGPYATVSPALEGTATLSSCQSVVHIGDSTSASLVSSDYLPNPTLRLEAQYAQVGATNQYLEIQGGTSIVETIGGGTNADTIAKQLIAKGYRGCWVLALGTNDAADVYVGSHVGYAARIRRLMAVIGNQPVMWVNVKSLVNAGPYSENNMLAWDRALVSACSLYPNMRVYDWASVVQSRWYIPDGIHYNTPGSAQRAHLIARALAGAFPRQGQEGYPGCVIP
jgi:peptidoglycan/LPS O-acetylase OafA/YrhL